MFPNLSIDEVMDLAARVGRRVANDYSGLDADDITSEILTRLIEKADKLTTDDVGYVYKVLETDAVRYAAKLRYDYMMAHANFMYTTREVRTLLKEAYFDPTMWDVPSAKDDYLTATLSKDTLGVSLVDLQEAWEKLKPSYREILLRKFRDSYPDIDTKAVSRAIGALTRYMNGCANQDDENHNGPGGRTVMSNSKAQFMTRNQW